VDGLWLTKSEGVGLIVRAIIVSKIFNLCGLDPPTSQTVGVGVTDGQTDGRYAMAIAMHRAVKTLDCHGDAPK